MTSKVTTDHDEIREWAAERGAKPSAVLVTTEEDDVRIRLSFSSSADEVSLNEHEISWQQFFESFEEARLALVIQDTTASGDRSNFNLLIKTVSDRRSVRR